MASATTDGSHASEPNPLPISVLATEAIGSALLCAGALVANRVLGNSTIDREPLTFIVTAASQALLALVTITLLARASGTLLLPNGAFARAAHSALSPDDTAGVIVAQLAGAALAGILIGAIDHVPVSTIPDLWSWGNLREGIAAFAIVIACRFATRDRATPSPIIVAIVIGLAVVGGARFLGLPTVVLANAFASIPSGGGILIGAVLAAQTIGLVIGLLLPSLGGGQDVPTSVGRAS